MPKILVRGHELTLGELRFRCAIGKGGFSADKKEGDGCTPLGAFALRECWYRGDRMTAPRTGLRLRLITPRDGWCDDPESEQYNRPIVLPSLAEDGDFDACLQVPSRELRSRLSRAQKALWRHLNSPRFSAYQFHRQYCMNGRYVIIVCMEKMLIIEADGENYDDSDEVARGRDAYLKSEGFHLLRFLSHEITDDIDVVLERIESALLAPVQISPPRLESKAKVPHHEQLWRKDGVYDLVVPLGYNDNPVVPGKGSAIFLHVARKNYAPTEGCIALALPDLKELLKRCDAGTVVEIREAQPA